MLALVLVCTAFAYESETQSFEVSDTAQVLHGETWESGWWPGDSTVSIGVIARAQTTGTVQMAGEADLWWPEDMNLALHGVDDGGTLDVVSTTTSTTYLRIDLFGYEFDVEIDENVVSCENSTTFDPLLPGNGGASVGCNQSDVVEYSKDLGSGFTATGTISVNYQTTASFQTDSIGVDGEQLSAEGDVATLRASGKPTESFEATVNGTWSGQIMQQVRVTAEVCYSGWCVDASPYSVDDLLASSTFSQAFEPSTLEFPVPLLDLDGTAYDIGSVEVGQVKTFSIPVHNRGAMRIEGTAELDGDSAIVLQTESFIISEGADGTLSVSLEPDLAGDFEATLTLHSSDPNSPEQTISLTASATEATEAAVDDEPSDTGDEPTEGAGQDTGYAADPSGEPVEGRGCGCSTGAPTGLSTSLLALLGMVAVRRRRD